MPDANAIFDTLSDKEKMTMKAMLQLGNIETVGQETRVKVICNGLFEITDVEIEGNIKASDIKNAINTAIELILNEIKFLQLDYDKYDVNLLDLSILQHKN